MTKKRKPARLPAFDKYEHYLKSVQSPDADAEFLANVYRKQRRKAAVTMREDFCGTFALCDQWVRDSKKHRAIGVDLDPEPLAYGHEKFFKKLKPEQQDRLLVCKANVLDKRLPKADLICALNFSYCIFHTRQTMLKYLKSCREALSKDGILVLDVLGGSLYQQAEEQMTRLEGFNYYWQQEYFNPIDNRTLFHINFKRRGERKRTKVFSYDWRSWSLPEIRDMLEEVGFKKTVTYWEGTKRNGEGNDIFSEATRGEECDSWVAYIAALK